MKKLFIVLVLVLIAAGIYWYFSGPTESTSGLSADQQATRDLLGTPGQFSISYQPHGEAGEFVRTEVWRYGEAKKDVTFIGGKIFASQDYEPPTGITAATLLPENFDVEMTLDEINAALGETAVLFDVPGVTTDTVKTYASSKALFTIEDNYLTYFETISTSQVPVE